MSAPPPRSPLRREAARFSLRLALLSRKILVQAHREDFLRDVAAWFETRHAMEDVETDSFDLRVSVDSWVSPSGRRRRYSVFSEPANQLPFSLLREDGAAAEIALQIRKWVVARTSTHYILHSGAVSRAGRAILLPGPTRSGKSTLAAALVRRGFGLHSDEAAVIDPARGLLLTVPVALAARRDVVRHLGLSMPQVDPAAQGETMPIHASDLGGRLAEDGARIILVVAPRFQWGSGMRLVRMEPGRAVLTLIELSCSQRSFGVSGLDILLQIVTGAPCYDLTYSDVGEAAAQVEQVFEEASAHQTGGPGGGVAPGPDMTLSSMGAGSAAGGSGREGRLVRRPDVMERRLAAELVLYDPECDRAYLLNATAAVIWTLCDGQHSAAQIAGRIVAMMQPTSEDVIEDVERTLEYFRRNRLLSR